MTEPAPTGSTVQTDTVIIGAGPAGLAVGACLATAGVPFEIVEQEHTVGASWRRHYDRLHLHTVKRHSGLPMMPFPADAPRYPSRQQVVDYLEAYAKRFHLAPRFGERVMVARRDEGGWELETAVRRYRALRLVIAAGYNRVPVVPTWPGRQAFRGTVIHSSAYRNGVRWQRRRALVVGLGNSGGEIALDLWESGASVSVSVRGPVRVVLRDTLGVPAQVAGIALSVLPRPVADRIGAFVARRAVGDLSPYGLREPAVGPVSQVKTEGRVPLIDVGLMPLIRQGAVRVVSTIRRFTPAGVELADGRELPLDLVVLATGYRAGIEGFLDEASLVTNARGLPRWHGEETPVSGLYFVGYSNPSTGALRAISAEAQRVAEEIARNRLM